MSGPRPLFLLGISERCGTNYLCDIVGLHPRCAVVREIWEDFLLAEIDQLERYVDRVSGHWKPRWEASGWARAALVDELTRAGGAWLTSLAAPDEVVDALYVVSKTPSVSNLARLKLFADARALVLLRDGRAVTESMHRTFAMPLAKAAAVWAEGAESVLAAQKAGAEFLLVRYEDLYLDSAREIGRILEYLDLDAEGYDFAAAANLPVRGSSSFGRGDGPVHWRPVARTPAFEPLARSDGWGAEERRIFAAVAGGYQRRLGYEL